MRQFFAALIFTLLWSAGAGAAERITNFDSTITVNSDGVLDVTETITVAVEHDMIRHGIYRDFPTVRSRTWLGKFRVDFKVTAVTRDGKPEPWTTERITDGVRVYIGDAQAMVPQGTHTYRLSYQTDRQIGFFPDHDELYWNATGNFWEFPIVRAATTVNAPPGATIGETAAYTGPVGSTATAVDVGRAANQATFVTTRSLNRRDGLTVVAAWPKGFVTAPTILQKLRYAIRDNIAILAAFVGLLLVLAYYLLTWWHYGRDPERGTVVAEYDPPKGMSAPACRYVIKQEWDDEDFTAAIVDMCARGYLKMEELDDGVLKVTKTGNREAEKNLPAAERAVAASLFTGGWTSIALRKEQHTYIRAAMSALRRALSTEHNHVHFLENRGLLVAGAALSAAAVALTFLLDPDVAPDLIVGAIIGGAVILANRIFRFSWRAAREASMMMRVVFVVLLTVAGSGSHALSGWVGDFVNVFANFPMRAVGGLLSVGTVLATALVVINLVFFEIMKAPTVMGRKLMDQIEGFRHYLTVAEKDRLNFHNPPELTPARFETYLPYAIALDVENAWGEQFNSAMKRVTAERGAAWHDADYTPGWYSGRRWSGGHWSGLTNSVGSAIASASVPPSSGSGLKIGGGGGGGFSGGGGGGGGGGGW